MKWMLDVQVAKHLYERIAFLMIDENFDLDSMRKQCRKDETKNLENLVSSKIDLEIEAIWQHLRIMIWFLLRISALEFVSSFCSNIVHSELYVHSMTSENCKMIFFFVDFQQRSQIEIIWSFSKKRNYISHIVLQFAIHSWFEIRKTFSFEQSSHFVFEEFLYKIIESSFFILLESF